MSKICDNCGQELPDSVLICSLCGERIATQTSTQNEHTPEAIPSQPIKTVPMSGLSTQTQSASNTSASKLSASVSYQQASGSSRSVGSIGSFIMSKMPQWATKRNIAMIVAAIVIIIFIVVIISGHSPLVGRWEPKSGSSAPSGFPDYFELFNNGTGELEGVGIMWVAEGGRLKIDAGGWIGSFTYDYKLSGNKLILVSNDTSVKYIKK